MMPQFQYNPLISAVCRFAKQNCHSFVLFCFDDSFLHLNKLMC